MSVQFIIGKSGSGKTTKAIETLIARSSKERDRSFLYIVPEQFTLETQKAFVNLHPRKSIFQVDILSFNRLSYKIFKELGINELNVLEDMGKNLILRKLAKENREDLLVLKDYTSNMSYIDEVKSLISEMIQYRVGPNMLRGAIDDSCGELLKSKAHDICLLYEKFHDYMRGSFVTGEMILDILAERIEESRYLRDSVIVFDGFTGFTPIQEVIISKLLNLNTELIFTATMDPEERSTSLKEDELFYMSKLMISNVTKMAGDEGVEVLSDVVMDNPLRFSKGGTLSFLENNIFRPVRRVDLSGAKDEVKVISLSSPGKELVFVARTIRKLIKNNVRYKNIAILCGNQNIYTPFIESVFGEYHIPVFVDKSEPIGFHPIVGLLRSLGDIIHYNYSPGAVTSFIKSGLIPISSGDIDRFENYIFATNIHGKKAYESPFKYTPRGVDCESLIHINETRERIVSFVSPLYSLGKSEKPVGTFNRCLYNFFLSIELEERLHEREEDGIYDILIDSLEKMEDLLSEEEMSFRDYMDLIFTSIGAGKLKKLPKASDMVTFGDIVRTRLDDIDYLFVIGANEGVIPPNESGGGFFSDRDRKVLFDMDIKLAPMERERRFAGIFYLYLCLTRAAKGLYISYSKTDGAGEIARPSFIVGMVEAMFKDTGFDVRIPMEGDNGLINPLSEMEAKRSLPVLISKGMVSDKDMTKAILIYKYCVETFGEDYVKGIIHGINPTDNSDKISEETLKALNGGVLNTSVSKLEKYAQCSYAYYLNYILKLQERVNYGVKSSDMGSIFHESLRLFFEESKNDIRNLSKSQRRDLIDSCVDRAYLALEGSGDYSLAFDTYVKNRVKSTMERTVWALSYQIDKGGYDTVCVEADIREFSDKEDLKISLSNGSLIKLNGIVDRIDESETQDKIYVKIVDYKSGRKSFDYTGAYNGIQIQLLFYLDARKRALEHRNSGKEILPSAVFYYTINDPLVESEARDIAEIESLILKELKPQGIMTEDPEALSKLDRDYEPDMPSYKSDVASFQTNKDGSFSKASALVEPSDMEYLLDYTRKRIKEAGESISRGEFSINPYNHKGKNGCEFCSYHGICNFSIDEGIGEYRYLTEVKDMKEFRDLNGA